MALHLHPFKPYLLRSLRGYDAGQFGNDLIAGVTVGVLALPLAMAFAIASGLAPEAGIFTAIIAGFIISSLGGSRVQIGGPAGAFIVVVYGIVVNHGLANLLISTIMAGALLFIMGLTRLGSLIRFIPVSIIIGFTIGIAVLIALSQLKEFLGLKVEDRIPAEFFTLLKTLYAHLHTIDPATISLGVATLAVIILWSPMVSRLPRRLRGLVTRIDRKRETVDVNAIATEVSLRLTAAQPDSRCVVRPLGRASADPAMLRQIFENLIGNAFKYSAMVRQPAIEIDLQVDQGTSWYRVRDNGIGFDMRYADRLFGMFQRMHSAAEFSGTGVGLAIVKRLVERHGGSVEAHSVPGQGATFRFNLGPEADSS